MTGQVLRRQRDSAAEEKKLCRRMTKVIDEARKLVLLSLLATVVMVGAMYSVSDCLANSILALLSLASGVFCVVCVHLMYTSWRILCDARNTPIRTEYLVQ